MSKKQKKMLYRILFAAALMVVLHFVPAEGPARFVLYLIPYLTAAYDILWKAVKGIRNGQVFDENFLMAVASIGALALGLTRTGDYVEAVAVMLFYQVGELFQSVAVGKSRRNISDLMDIRPDYANVEENGELVEVDPEDVAIGTEILVKPGERVPIDGIVTEGTSTLDTAALTGESIPRDVAPGNEIVSGCINMTGLLRIRTTKEFGESTVAKILDMVENATSMKSRSENFISRFARVYTPAVCISALVLAILPPLVQRGILQQTPDWADWFYRALTFLVISCPCALVVSIPLSFFASIGGASRAGVLVKGSSFLEAMSQVTCMVFDKTGTLTKGIFEVQEICPAADSGISKEQLLECAALAESASTHPISESIRRAHGEEPDLARVKNIEELGGHGVSALVDGKAVAAGNRKLMEKLGIACENPKDPGTVVHVAAGGRYAGYIRIADSIKDTSAEAITALRKEGVKKLVMLTGDSRTAAEQVSAQLGMDALYSELLPADKVQKVEELLSAMRGGEKLAFAGDGINDAPVLGRADVGIAMGAMGSDAAIEAADVVLMHDDPMQIVKAVRIAKKCMRIVYENIVFAIGIKLICLLLGALGIANMWLAVFADVGVMILAVLNSIRALRIPQ